MTQTAPSRLIVVVGMVSEARIVEAEGVTVIIGGGHSDSLAEALGRALAEGAVGLVSFGLCGALDPALKVGDLVVMSSDPAWTARLLGALPSARVAAIVGGDTVVPDARTKSELRRATGAGAVDMETHIVKRLAGAHGIPFAALRAVSDASDRALPAAARIGLGADGRPDIIAVLKAVISDPRQIPALIRTAREAGAALGSLVDARHLLGPGIGCLDFRQHPVHVA